MIRFYSELKYILFFSIQGGSNLEQNSQEYQYSILIDILAEMVTSYLTMSKSKNHVNDKKGEDKNAN